ncbi:MAG: D-2-hydroxyacid dehydrogenase [Candidatus Eremiobacteraeota bacterium]|nr:D-2-hydroxyacid dehydrogenase [Candidatus Eremiobacteraeota bacterium]MBC5801540.1 D-2-hydroxyacid dehydrogenase [Candidatus Eremiobacteraeota bacterium]MBC5822831.1 D-2-hydroxyacid dehydrogenase [Candidatus Eremiobacteraeota bacterium]
MIASPLEPELVQRIRELPVVDEVLYDPTLLPLPLFPNDHAGDPAFRRDARQQSAWNAMLSRARVLFGYPRENGDELARTLQAAPHVRFVQGTSAGMGAHLRRAALPAALLKRVTFASAAGVHAGMLAEFVFYGLLALRKDARRLERMRRERLWKHYVMGELFGSTLVVVGFGQVGTAIAQRARAFGMRVIAVGRTATAHSLADESCAVGQLESAFSRSDAVAVTLPLTDTTRGLISAQKLAALGPSAVFINVGRGAVVDQAALVAMLADGRLAGAVLDVCDPEPLPRDHPLWDMENVILSPHTAALSRHENERIVALFCDNLKRLAAARPLRNVVNLTEFY